MDRQVYVLIFAEGPFLPSSGLHLCLLVVPQCYEMSHVSVSPRPDRFWGPHAPPPHEMGTEGVKRSGFEVTTRLHLASSSGSMRYRSTNINFPIQSHCAVLNKRLALSVGSI
jgi:hypothetical protein